MFQQLFYDGNNTALFYPSSHLVRKHFFFWLKLTSRQGFYCCWNSSLLSCMRFYLLHFNNPLQVLFLSDSYPTLLLIIVSINTFPQQIRKSRKPLLSFTDLVKECYLSWPGSQRQKQWNNPAPPSCIYQGGDLVCSRTWFPAMCLCSKEGHQPPGLH